MSDYKVSLGAKVRTDEIDKQLKDYDGKVNIGVNTNNITNGIDAAIRGYTASPIEVDSTLNTKGITDKIKSLNAKSNRKKVKVALDHTNLFDGLETVIANKTFATPLKVNVSLNWSGVASQIANPDFGATGKPTFNVDVDFDDQLIETKWNAFAQSESKKRKLTIPIRPTLTGADAAEVFSDVEETLATYVPKSKLKVQLFLSKAEINQAVTDYNRELANAEEKKIIFNAKLRADAIDGAINDYLTKYPDKLKIPIDLKINSELDKNTAFDAALKQKIEQYENTPVWISARLKKAKQGFLDQIKNVKVPIEATLANASAINDTLQQYSDKPLPVTAKLVPAAKGFANEITKTPITIEAELAPDAINNAITDASKSVKKIPISVTIAPKDANDINNQIKQLKPFATENLEVGVKLDEKSVNTAITSVHPTEALKVKPDLMLEEADKQIEAYVPKVPIKVNVLVNDGDIDDKTGLKNAQDPITVNVRLDRKSINDEIKAFNPSENSKINIGVNLDFKSHKDKETKEYIQKGIAQQIKEYQGKTKLKVGVELDKNSIETEISQFNPNTPVSVGVELTPESVQRVHSQIDDIRQRLQNLGGININLNSGTSNDGNNGGQDIQTVRIARGTSDATRAYREMISILGRLGTAKKDLEKLNLKTVKTQADVQEIEELTRQIDNLDGRYKELHKTFSSQFDAIQLDTLRIRLETIEEKLERIRSRALEAEDGLDKVASSGQNANGSDNGLADGSSTTNASDIANTSDISDVIEKFKEADIVINATNDQINNLKTALKEVGFNSSSVESIEEEFRTLGVTVTNVTTKLNKDGSVKLTVKGLDQFKNAVTYVNNVGSDGSLGNWSTAISKDINNIGDNFRTLKETAQKIANIKIDIFKSSNDAQEVERLTKELNELESEYEELFTTTQGGLDTKQLAQLTSISEKAATKIAELKAELAKSIPSNFGKYDNELLNLNNRFAALADKPIELKQEIENVGNALRALKEADGTDDLISKNNEYIELLNRVEEKLLNLELLEKGENYQERFNIEKASAIKKLENMFSAGSEAAKVYGKEVENLRNKLDKCGNITGIKNVNKEIDALGRTIKRSSVQTQTLGEKLKNQFAKYSSYFSVASLFMYAEQGLRSMFEQVKLIDSAMTELKKVTNETDASYNRFLKNAASRARELGTTIDGLVSSTSDFARLGYGFEDSQKLAEVANIYAVVGDEIDGVEDATQSLVSTMAAFKSEMNGMDDGDFAMGIVDKMNEVSNNFAISSGGIGEALQRSASSMAAANNTLDETIAMITAANEVAQNPEKVGNAMKTMSMRIRGAKTELEEAGESTDGMAESTATLRAEIKALSGVDIMLNDDTFKSTYQIMDELSKKWENLSDIAQATIIELVAGKHQGNVFSSLMANFDTARKALDTSLNSSGSAMAEHAKWSESLEARLNRLSAAWQGLSQAFMNSDVLKVVLDAIIALADGITKLIDTIGIIPTIIGAIGIGKIISSFLILGGEIKSFGDIFLALEVAFPKIAAVFTGFFATLFNGKGIIAALKVGLKGLWGVIAAHPILATVAAIGLAITAYNHFTESAEELAERIEEVTTKYKEQHNALTKLRGNYDTSNEDSLISKYGRLSKGVNALGENVSLTADEYSEYQDIVATIANQMPSLITGYNSQGDAILSCAGSVEKLTEAYHNLIKEQNKEVLDTGADIFKDFKNDLENTSAHYQKTTIDAYDMNGNVASTTEHNYNTNHLDALSRILGLSGDELEEAVKNLQTDEISRISDLLNENGAKRDVMFDNGWLDFDYESQADHIIRVLNEDRANVKKVLEDASNDLNEYAEDLGSVTEAYFSTAFLGGDNSLNIGDYSSMSDEMQNIVRQIMSGFDTGFYAQFLNNENPYESLVEYFNSMLDKINSVDANTFEAAFDLKTKFNGGEISYGEYVEGLKNAGELIDGLGLEPEIASQIKLSLGLSEKDGKWIVEEYETLLNRLTSEEHGIKLSVDEAEELLSNLTASEYAVALDLIASGEVDLSNFNIDSLREYIEEQTKLSEALSFTVNMEAETAGIEALNTALAESKSATGLATESIATLKSRYKDLDSYDAAALFEETANGIRINATELAKLEKEYKDFNKQKTDKTLTTLKEEYDKLTDEIAHCTNDQEKLNDLYLERDAVLNQINNVATLAAQYDGLTSAYKEWQSAQEAGQDRDMYESILSGREEIEGEMSRGWLDDATVEYLELLSGKDLSTAGIQAQIEAYKELNKTIDGTNYKIWDFFTQDKDGNSTSEGVYNFFEAVKDASDETAAYIKDGKYHFDFEGFEYNGKVGDAAIAELLGTSEELVQIILKAAEDAGFVVNIKGEYTDLANMSDDIQNMNEQLKRIGATEYTFNIKSTDLNYINEQITEAKSALQYFENRDGKINLDDSDVRAAATIMAQLVYRKSDLENPTLMSIDVSEPATKLEEVLGLAQQLKDANANLEIQTEIGADTTEAQAQIDSLLAQISSEKYADIVTGLSIDATSKENAIASINAISADTMISLGLDTSKIDGYVVEDKDATVTYEKDSTEVDEYDPPDFTRTVTFTVDSYSVDIYDPDNLTRTVTYKVKTEGEVSEANGTANVNGTAFAGGTAFKQGNWGIKGSGTALVGELGTETLVRDGRFYTIGDSGAEFIKYRQGDIIFNHKQTEELFKNGKVTSGGGRGRALAEGTAFAIGSGGFGFRDDIRRIVKEEATVSVKTTKETEVGSYAEIGENIKGTLEDAVSEVTDASDSSSSSSYSEEEFEDTFDWVEIAISRIERAIDQLDKKANNVYQSWSDRNSALTSEINKVGDEIDLQQKAYDRYIQEANSVGLSSSWAEKVRNGEIDINTIADEDLAEKIRDYQTWYEKALDCQDAIEDLKEKEAELYAQRVENVATQYEGILGVIEHEKNMLEEYISQAEAQGYMVSGEYYKALMGNEQDTLSELEKQKAAMLEELQTAMESGTIAEGSEAWYDMIASIDEVTLAIAESETALLEYEQILQQLNWKTFDLLQDKISAVTEEADFLIDLLSSDKLYDENGNLTDEGSATMGLHGQNYNTYMHQADLAAEEAEKLRQQLEEDPYDAELEERYREMIALQQEYILAAENEKEAIRDMVEEGIQLELDALDERIQKYEESIESARDLYEYNKKVKEQAEEIASLEKQRSAYLGDTSEEGRARLQQIEVSLKEAKEELQETEYDRYISDQQQLLDELRLQYEEILNMRLDNIDALIADMIAEINADSAVIGDTIRETADSVGYTLSDSMQTIWDASTTKINDVLTVYGEKFSSAQTTTNNALNTININLQNMIAQLNKIANTNVESASTSSAANSEEAKTPEEPPKEPVEETPNTSSTIEVGGKINAGSAKIYDYAGDTSGESQYFKNDPIYTVLGEKNGYLKVRHHKLSSGVTGWFKKGDVKAYASGKKNFMNDEVAWTQDGGREFIVRPSDGAILTPIAKGDSVLTSTASKNIWSMANTPTEFIREHLKFETTNIPNGSATQSSYTQHIDNVVFRMDNIKNYEEMLSAMKADKNFERLILSMSIDRIAGKSGLAKGKSIR